MIYTTGKTLIEIFFGTNHKNLCQWNLASTGINANFVVQSPGGTNPPTLKVKNYENSALRQPFSTTTFSGALGTWTKRYFPVILEKGREQTSWSCAYFKRFKSRHHLEVSQKLLYKNHRQHLSRSHKCQQQRLGSLAVKKEPPIQFNNFKMIKFLHHSKQYTEITWLIFMPKKNPYLRWLTNMFPRQAPRCLLWTIYGTTCT